MYHRNILEELVKWRRSNNRKPLIIRGARQVGKTTVIQEFANQYQQYIYLNLERKEDAAIFQNYTRFATLVEAIFFLKDKDIQQADTLIFIDEIQEVPEALNLLRYFYEDFPQLHVIAAGSLLEAVLNENMTMPVGRVEFKVLRPMSFEEFLDAMGENAALQQYRTIPVADFAHDKLLQLFHTYTLIGGMPEIIAHYVENRNFTALIPIYESLLVSYMNDVEKYARNNTMVQVIRHVIKSMSVEAGNRIKFQHFGQSNYGSREVGEAVRTIEKALLLYLVYPCTGTSLPLFPDKKKSPRLQLLDTGLMNHLAGIQKEIIATPDLDLVYKGKVAEHIVGQELLATQYNVLSELHFWTREKKDATAEVDYVYIYDGHIIPIEVKSGATGRLRSLHAFMEHSPQPMAVRVYGGKLSTNTLETPNGKVYQLLNLPYYLTGQLEKYLAWFGTTVGLLQKQT
ncbi:AAA family ATPase [Haliscomenobacter sp.]|uniref:ATP-binding protein n=1 Tax=Haliscomenobacter sp. TaxID=2717303 RepID=UPI0033651EF2